MRLFHYAGCLFRAVRAIPFIIIFTAVTTYFLLEEQPQFRFFMEDPRFRWFLLAFGAIFLLAILGGLRKRIRQMGCVVTFLAIGPFVLLGTFLGYLVSVIVIAASGAGPAAESTSLLARSWRTLVAFPAEARIPTLVGAASGFISLVGEIDSDNDSSD
jgi:hypothetical protein